MRVRNSCGDGCARYDNGGSRQAEVRDRVAQDSSTHQKAERRTEDRDGRIAEEQERGEAGRGAAARRNRYRGSERRTAARAEGTTPMDARGYYFHVKTREGDGIKRIHRHV